MGRSLTPEHREAFEALEDSDLYTSAHVARLAPFSGTEKEIQRRRRNFRANLNSYYRKLLPDEPDDRIAIDGDSLYPAWLGQKWKAVGLR